MRVSLYGLMMTSLLLLAAPGPAFASWPGSNGRIAFQEPYQGRSTIKTMTPEGEKAHRLSRSSRPESEPSYSPNGRRIVFHRQVKKHQGDLFTMHADGSHVRRLTHRKLADVDAGWTANGRSVVFTRQATSGHYDLFRVRAAGGDVTRITRGGGDEFHPICSPDGDRIAYIRENIGLFTIDNDGSGRSAVLDWAETADWSPSGDDFVVTGSGPDGQGVYTVAEDGLGVELVAKGAAWFAPVWAPNGRKIVVQKLRLLQARPGIYVMKSDGSKKVRIRTTRKVALPDWQPR